MIRRFVEWIRSLGRRPQGVRFASTERVLADPGLHDDFIVRVLGFKRSDPVFISDVSMLHDFGDEAYVAELRSKICDAYGVDVSDLRDGLLCEIFERIARKANHSPEPAPVAVHRNVSR